MHTPSQVDHRAAVAAQTARFVDILAGADYALAVQSCPGWTLADLVKHVGSVQRWFSALLNQRIQQPPTSRDVELELPEKEADYPEWLTASAAVAAQAFTDSGDLDDPMWAWGADQHARFWVRRMLFETLLHRVDAELALGLRSTIDHDLAADGVDEFLVNLPYAHFFAPKTANLRSSGDAQTIRFSCADVDRAWTIRLRPDGFGLEQAATATADATVHGNAQDLLLFLYGRLDLAAAGLDITGDQELLHRWVANSAF
ncbi:maleylpyruvate isomerase family mycothiol-dependent enzyme [Streptacidiphilus sp. 4-A2]|nr:maleylpyruvate isomerase family mycothiol-dependent enzyme [Streptacidiphilus sp. 4-A2]